MPPQIECDKRVVGVTPKGFTALQRQMQALEEKMHKGMNLLIRDESEDEDEIEENVGAEVVLNP